MNYLIGTRIEIQTSNNILALDNFISLEITQDINSVVNAAKITIPSNKIEIDGKDLTYFANNGSTYQITPGEKVYIDYDYARNGTELSAIETGLTSKFVGYVRQFNISDEEIEIVVDDSMYLFKTKKFKNSYSTSTTISQIIDSLIGYYGIEDKFNLDNIQDITIGQIRTDGYMTGTQFLNKIKEEYHLYFYTRFIDNKPYIYAGLKYNNIPDKDTASFSYPYNNKNYPVLETNLSHNKIDKEDDLIVIGSSKQIDNSILTVITEDGINVIVQTVSDKDTEKTKSSKDLEELKANKKVIKEFNIPEMNIDLLKEYTLKSWNNYNDGLEGSFTTFAAPLIDIGETIQITNEEITERHFVDAIITSITANDGLTREITLGTKLKI